jgi:hypothetical protein
VLQVDAARFLSRKSFDTCEYRACSGRRLAGAFQGDGVIEKLLLAAALATLAGIALAQAYPTRPLQVIIGFPPGGGIDIVGRTMAPRLD